ncbi:MAG: AIR synthase-related protein [Candidatus Woesearchaeota archaeon]|jgi:phosphoribosylformylglycinamidine cyclo-ligase|nr:AIR synthase-related protein [Candidatus Woesearchaeota archaeon]
MTNPDYQKRESVAVSEIKKAIPKKLKADMIPESNGLFTELYQNKVFPNHYLACAIDGVGTKLLLADALEIYNTVGIDLVAMSANDLITLPGTTPFLFLNYLAIQEKISSKSGEILKGIVKGLEQCEAGDILNNNININLGKGETASVDELISSFKPGFGFDLAGAMIGFIEKSKLNIKVNEGDKIIALKSSGPHSNGYTDLRLNLLKGDFETRPEFKKNYKGKFKLDDPFENSTIGKTLLEPTKIYVKTISQIAKKFNIVGINNTGYGLKNLNRLKGNFEFLIDNPIPPQQIFNLVQEESNFTDEQMYKKFNMGMGFFIIANPEDSEEILKIAKQDSPQIVGEVRKSNKLKTTLVKDNKNIVFEGY